MSMLPGKWHQGNYIFLNGNCPDWSCKRPAGPPCSDPIGMTILPEINGDMTISTWAVNAQKTVLAKLHRLHLL